MHKRTRQAYSSLRGLPQRYACELLRQEDLSPRTMKERNPGCSSRCTFECCRAIRHIVAKAICVFCTEHLACVFFFALFVSYLTDGEDDTDTTGCRAHFLGVWGGLHLRSPSIFLVRNCIAKNPEGSSQRREIGPKYKTNVVCAC